MMNEMVTKMMEMVDLTEVGTWMVEAIPQTVTEMQKVTIGEQPDDFDENYERKSEEFFEALWVALAQANSEKAKRDAKMLEVLKDHTIKNATEVSRDTEWWNDSYSEEERQEFIEAIERCQEGNGTDEDWDWLVEMTEM